MAATVDPAGLRKPDLLCIGAQKAGTSWLHEMLGSRPDVFVPPFKELHFFDHKFIPGHRKWVRVHVSRGVAAARRRHLDKGRADPRFLAYLDRIGTEPMFTRRWYGHVFSRARADQVCLDVTPEYGGLPPEGIAFACEFLPKARFLFIVRAPLDRALSQLKMNVGRKAAFDGSEAAWTQAAANPDLEDRGAYALHLPRWQAAVGERLRILPYGRIGRDPLGFMREVEVFAGLPPHTYRDLKRRVWASPPLEVPKAVVADLARRTAPEAAFLRQALGEEFCAGI